jgi:hypothetical protein
MIRFASVSLFIDLIRVENLSFRTKGKKRLSISLKKVETLQNYNGQLSTVIVLTKVYFFSSSFKLIIYCFYHFMLFV